MFLIMSFTGFVDFIALGAVQFVEFEQKEP